MHFSGVFLRELIDGAAAVGAGSGGASGCELGLTATRMY